MTAPIIRTDETTEAIGAVAKALAELRAAKANADNWKWTIIALHNALQGFMVLTLKFTNPVLVTRLPGPLRKFEKEILTAYNNRQLVRDLPAKENPRRKNLARDIYVPYAEKLALTLLSAAELRARRKDEAKQRALRDYISTSPVWLLDAQLVDFLELFRRIQKEKYAPYTLNP